ncbi:hypothetical protein KC19_10G141100 [Ceratodon purpureus]|uniref:F-box domain-containing protein n=1 Tax=Ceratodon purpureus TaxID=3225 RepID=A0A8T0GQG2_CERPU|nr:hypothetical protein KC19_10G141100 [Ceratodon purpureus]
MVVINEELPYSLNGGESSVLQQQASSSCKDSERNVRRRKTMDPEVWGNLPANVAFEIYKKLPMRDFLTLREVCKEWNQLARERRCVTDPIHKPYFVLVQMNERNKFWGRTWDHSVMLHGILTFHIKSSSWVWSRLPGISVSKSSPSTYKCDLLSVKGLTFGMDYRGSYEVLDVQSKSRYSIPRQPRTSNMPCALGMTVDTSVEPPTFKIILGSHDVGTQIYDSVTRSWESRDSSLLESYREPKLRSCLDCGNNLYISSDLKKILVYSLNEDKWSELNPLPRPEVCSSSRALGLWQGHIFAVISFKGVSSRARRAYSDEGANRMPLDMEAPFLWIWKLPVDHSEETQWEEVDEMPLDMQKWLLPLDDLRRFQFMEIHASFCEEHVLIYSWVPERCLAHRLVFHDLATKTWEKVEVPNHSISILCDNWTNHVFMPVI